MVTVMPTRLSTPLLVGLGGVVFLANAGLLVLQLLAGRYLAPFIGSSVETWTSVIGVFLTGIALGNHFGGIIADRRPNARTLGILLLLGGVSSLSMLAGSQLFGKTGCDSFLSLTARIPILAGIFCLPPAFILSLITPLTINGNRVGSQWYRGQPGSSAFSTLFTPNSKIPNVTFHCAGCGLDGRGIYAARSKHVGGVHALMCDGSVKFIGENIDWDTWNRVGSRYDGATVGDL